MSDATLTRKLNYSIIPEMKRCKRMALAPLIKQQVSNQLSNRLSGNRALSAISYFYFDSGHLFPDMSATRAQDLLRKLSEIATEREHDLA